jgi:small conductance mechanosensitive channel
MLASITPLSDYGTWFRTDALQIVMLLSGTFLVSRAVTRASRWLTERFDERIADTDALVRSQAAKHRHAVTGVVTGVLLAGLYFVAGVLVVERFGVPLATLVAPAAAVGVALGFGAQTVVGDLLAGFLIVGERQYGYGDIIKITAVSSGVVVQGTVEEVTLRITRIRSTARSSSSRTDRSC